MNHCHRQLPYVKSSLRAVAFALGAVAFGTETFVTKQEHRLNLTISTLAYKMFVNIIKTKYNVIVY